MARRRRGDEDPSDDELQAVGAIPGAGLLFALFWKAIKERGIPAALAEFGRALTRFKFKTKETARAAADGSETFAAEFNALGATHRLAITKVRNREQGP